ncbi:DNA methyltransferase [Catenulispora subtropica]|uniref:DNA methylase N-4/N-6 domain-containing protein n=1 Tax=Catenulispora subtropica TaxID=450798 RepID=A0ABP5E2I8_9ACTN
MIDIRDIDEPVAASQPLTRAITRYTMPGDLIVDLGCGDGRTLIEAIRADRLAIGIERNRRLAETAREAVVQATAHGGPGFAAVVVGELADVPKLIGPDSLGKATLVLVDMARVGVLGEHARVDAAEALGRFATVLDVGCALLRPGGHALVSAQSDLLDEIETAVDATSAFDMVEELCAPELGAVHRQVPAAVMRFAAAHA